MQSLTYLTICSSHASSNLSINSTMRTINDATLQSSSAFSISLLSFAWLTPLPFAIFSLYSMYKESLTSMELSTIQRRLSSYEWNRGIDAYTARLKNGAHYFILIASIVDNGLYELCYSCVSSHSIIPWDVFNHMFQISYAFNK